MHVVLARARVSLVLAAPTAMHPVASLATRVLPGAATVRLAVPEASSLLVEAAKSATRLRVRGRVSRALCAGVDARLLLALSVV